MNDHLSMETLEKYRSQSLSPMELLDADDHLSDCDECRSKLALSETEAGLPAAAVICADLRRHPLPIEHLSYEMLSAYVDETLPVSERGTVEAHLLNCSVCRREQEVLMATRAEMTTYAPKVYAPETHPSLPDKLKAIFSRPATWVPLQVGSLAAVAVITVALTTHSYRSALNAKDKDNKRLAVLNSNLGEKVRELQQEKKAAFGAAQNPDSTQPPSPTAPGGPKTNPAQPTEDDRIASGNLPSMEGPAPTPPLIVETPPQTAPSVKDKNGEVKQDSSGEWVYVKPLPSRVKTALASKTLGDSPELSGLMPKTGVLRGAVNQVTPVSPVSTAILTNHPTLEWKRYKEADSYEVTLTDSQGNVTKSGQVMTLSWKPSALKPGETYTWQVEAFKSGQAYLLTKDQLPAKFKVIEPAKARQIEQQIQEYGNSSLVRGIVYAQNGLLDDAQSALASYLKEHPDSAEAKAFSIQIKKMRS